jgi:hypothetical protein
LRTPDMSVGTARNLSAVDGSGTSTSSDLSTHTIFSVSSSQQNQTARLEKQSRGRATQWSGGEALALDGALTCCRLPQ